MPQINLPLQVNDVVIQAGPTEDNSKSYSNPSNNDQQLINQQIEGTVANDHNKKNKRTLKIACLICGLCMVPLAVYILLHIIMYFKQFF